jgi:hypothetical protein
MSNPTVTTYNLETGEEYTHEMTNAELAEFQAVEPPLN